MLCTKKTVITAKNIAPKINRKISEIGFINELMQTPSATTEQKQTILETILNFLLLLHTLIADIKIITIGKIGEIAFFSCKKSLKALDAISKIQSAIATNAITIFIILFIIIYF